jgi:hypothetical protein
MTHEIMIDKRMFTGKLNLMSSMNVKTSIDRYFPKIKLKIYYDSKVRLFGLP